MKKSLIFFLLVFFASMPAVGHAMECVDLSTNLKQGMRGGEVTKLQVFLKEKGYLAANPTGYFGMQTLKSVKSFQKSASINPTGFVGPLTRTFIKDATCTITQAPEAPINPESVVIPPSTTPVNDTPVIIVDPAPTPVVEDVILTAPNNSSLKVRTDGPVTIGSSSVTVKGTITAGARSATMRWFELTKNKDVYKLSETTKSTKKSQRTNEKFEEIFSDLAPGTTYYVRACAENVGLGQKSCGGTTSFKTNN
ncbi:MAG: peptidoglycan-binding domain-containing protein [Candidatus Paceibacterota bacterium]